MPDGARGRGGGDDVRPRNEALRAIARGGASALVSAGAFIAFAHLWTGGWIEAMSTGDLSDTVGLNALLLLFEVAAVGSVVAAWVRRVPRTDVLLYVFTALQVMLYGGLALLFWIYVASGPSRLF